MTDKALSPLRRKDIETGRKLEREMLRDVIQYRISVYQQKRDKEDPLADETFNKHEALTYVIEALEIVKAGLGSAK